MKRSPGSIKAGVALLGLLSLLPAIVLVSPASAEPSLPGPRRQEFVTPTPGPDGKIIYIVQDGDVLWTIAALSGKSVEELMALNGLQPNEYLTTGMRLLLGVG